MSQYKVLEVVELDGVMQPVDSVVEIAPEVAESLIAEGKVSVVDTNEPASTEGAETQESPAEETPAEPSAEIPAE